MENFIRTYDNVLDPRMCDKLIYIFESSNDKYDGKYSKDLKVNKKIKNTTDLHFNHINDVNKLEISYVDKYLCDIVKKHTEKYLLDINSKTIANENPQERLMYSFLYNGVPTLDSGFNVQKYKANDGFYIYHNDTSVEEDKYRTLTYLFYLNDVEEGGETEFFGDYKIKPKQGRLLLFPATWLYPHRGCMPKSNDKYICTGWLYNSIVKNPTKKTE